jgi:hypothetical protein
MTKDAKLTLLQTYYRAHGLNLGRYDIERLQKVARKLQTSALNLCNIPNYQAKHDKTIERAWKELMGIFATSGMSPSDFELSGDPRGLCLQIKCPNGQVVMPEQFN